MELVIRSLEETTLQAIINEMCLYLRYVDDILVIWRSDKTQCLQELFTILSYGLSLALDQCIHFVDVKLEVRLNISNFNL